MVELLKPKLWLVDAPDDFGGYDTYSDFVVCCATEWEARAQHPSEPPTQPLWTVAQLLSQTEPVFFNNNWLDGHRWVGDWIRPEDRRELAVTRLGVADASCEKGVVCSSFHAG